MAAELRSRYAIRGAWEERESGTERAVACLIVDL